MISTQPSGVRWEPRTIGDTTKGAAPVRRRAGWSGLRLLPFLGLSFVALTLAAGAAEKRGALERPRTGEPGSGLGAGRGSTAGGAAGSAAGAGTNTVESVTALAKDSLVVITQFGRDGREEGVGAGFVIGEEGLIATSLHVIGEARPVRVRLAGGRVVDVVEVHASDRKLDLAILRVEAGRLRPLRLGDSDKLAQGASVVALGNPLGLEHSVVQGVLSARREFDGIEMLQLAIPIEPGNSGGPLLDMRGRVHGILTLKSAMTANLGFAMPVNALKRLLERPNPVPMSRWLTLGAVNPRDWTTVFGAKWVQRAGRIQVEGAGKGFGGRSLCLSKTPAPALPFEVAVEVRLDDEAGAAGLAFGADGADRHYGFYPSGGQLRLTRFEGPNVFSWNILRQVTSPQYQRGAWNHLRVRVETNVIRCFVNGELACEVPGDEFAGEAVGLAKFRDTRAEFRGFRVGTNLASGTLAGGATLPESVIRRLEGLGASADLATDGLGAALRPHAESVRAELTARARRLERDAAGLRRVAGELHRDEVRIRLEKALEGPEAGIDLFYAALLVARHDDPDLDVEGYREQLRSMARELEESLPAGSDNEKKLAALREYLFTRNGFHGSRSDYHNRANSYINRVLDDREGLPITLSVLFLELARAIGLEGVAGAPLPGHFMVRYAPRDGELRLIDVFDGGRVITRGEAQERVLEATGEGFRDEHLEPAGKRDIIVRMLRNLQANAERDGEALEALHYADLLVTVSVGDAAAAERLTRVRLRLQRGDRTGAREDLKWILDRQPGGLDLERVADLYRSLEVER